MDRREKHYDLGNVAHFLVSGIVVALLAIKIDEKTQKHQRRKNLK